MQQINFNILVLKMNLILKFDVLRITVSLVIILFLDSLWLTMSKNLYDITNYNLYYGFIAWTALAFAISCGSPTSFTEAYKYGAFIGFVSYATFNGTELAIRPSWRHPSHKSIIDMFWGTTACSVTSILLYGASSTLKRNTTYREL